MLDIYWKAGKMGFQTKQGMHLTTARWRYAERLDDRTGIVCDAAGYALLRIHPRRLIPLDCERVSVWYEFAATGNSDYSTGTGKSLFRRNTMC